MLTPSAFFKFILPLVAALLLTACGTTSVQVTPGKSLGSVVQVFVETNRTDDHKVGAAIATSLRERGYQATYGPMTMLPDKAQVIVSYEDIWIWDFKEHIAALRLRVRDVDTSAPLAGASWEGAASVNADPALIVRDLVGRLFPQRQR